MSNEETNTPTTMPITKGPTAADEWHQRLKRNTPLGWRMILDCNHTVALDNEQIKNSLVDSQYTPEGTATNIVCPQCAKHAPGSCDQGRIIHRIVQMNPVY
jgi:hypothetical protein